ncbi:MAG TPA: hypothetical protein VLC09_00040 [Polyangiaceae bacterium]|nr:hypothetical protein [Polyangiaceae bacterium]
MQWRLLSLAWACGLASAAFGCDDDGVSHDDGAGGAPAVQRSIAFTATSTLTMSPSESVSLSIEARPEGPQAVSFGLLGDAKDAFDASLDPTRTLTDPTGLATTQLRAPSTSATFWVRAWLDDDHEARRAVSVSAEGFAQLRVIPRYSGLRKLGEWTASARAGTSCADWLDKLSDGPLVATGEVPLDIEAVPVGPSITVTVRAGALAQGCVTVPRLEAEELRELEIPVTDLPLHIDRGGLSLEFGIDYASPAFDGTLSTSRERASVAWSQGKQGDAAALLEAWGKTLTDSRRAELVAATTASSLVQVIEDEWGVEANATPLRDLLDAGLEEASGSLATESTFTGQLAFSSGTFTLDEVSGIEASQTGFVLTSSWTASTEPGDVLVLSGALEYEPAAWLCAVAEGPGTTAALTSSLSNAADCMGLASALLSAHGGALYSGCDTATCVRSGCEAAVSEALRAASRADRDYLTTLAIAMTGNAEPTEKADIASYEGSWLGTANPGEAPLSGSVSGSAE